MSWIAFDYGESMMNKAVSRFCHEPGEGAVVHGAPKNVLPHENIFFFAARALVK
jgi:hypothetical protein